MRFSDLLTSFRATPTVRRWQIALCWSWFFLVLLAYYLIKPLRDAWGTPLADRLGDLYLGTFVATLIVLPIYSQLVSWLSRLRLVHVIYHASAACLITFAVVSTRQATEGDLSHWLIALFFIWVSVFNLLVVTVFWSVMADLFHSSEGELWFGSMAAFGSLGSLAGSVVAKFLVQHYPAHWLLLAAAATCELIVLNAWIVLRLNQQIDSGDAVHGSAEAVTEESDKRGTGGTLWAGVTSVLQSPYLLGICLFVALGKFGATFIYNNLQLVLDAQMPDAQERTILFAHMNVWTQSGSLILQAVGAAVLMQTLGVGTALSVPCLALVGIFAWLSMQVSLSALVVSQVAQQILGYGLLVPAQHVLFTVVSREEKYKTKAFVDMVVFRGSDVAAGKTCQWMIHSGTVMTVLALWMLPAMVLWTGLAMYLGTAYRRRLK